MWTLGTGLAVVADVQQPSRQFGYHVAMGGGVLNTGASNKDLDLYFLPLDGGDRPNPVGLLEFLETLWGASAVALGNPDYPAYHSHYTSKVKFLLPDGRRIDAFIL